MKTIAKKALGFVSLTAMLVSTLAMATSAADLSAEQSVKEKNYIQVDVTATKNTTANEWVVGCNRLGDIDYTTPAEGDVYLEYTVQVLNQVQGIGHIDFFSGGNTRQWWLDINAPAADQNGILAGRVDLSKTAEGGEGPAYKKWYTRKIKMENNYKLDTMFVQTWIPGGTLKKDETVSMLYKDIRFVDGEGKVLFNVFKDYLDRDFKGNINNFDMSMSNGFGTNATSQGYYVHAVQYEAGKAVDVKLPVTKEYAAVYNVKKAPANGTAAVARKGADTLSNGMDTLTYTPKADFKGYDEVVLEPRYLNAEAGKETEKVGSATDTGSAMRYKFVLYAKAEGGTTPGGEDGEKEPPKTGDSTPFVVVPAVLLSALALTAAVVMKKKQSDRV